MEQQKMNSPTSPQPDTSLDDLSKLIEDYNRFEKKTKVIGVILPLAILAVFVIFGWLFYCTIKANFTKDKFVASIKIRGEEIKPLLTHQMLNIIEKVRPVYTEEAKKKFQELVPQLRGLTETQLREIVDRTNTKINDVTKEVLGANDTLLRSLYPNLSPEDLNLAKITNEKAWVDEFGEVSQATIEPFSKDWNNMKNTLEKFDNKALPNDEGELMRLMTHYLLMLLDKEIMEVK